MVVQRDLAGISVEDYVHAWEPELEAALARGFDAAWWARFPIGPDAEIIDRSVEPTTRAWDAHFHGRPCVSLCLFIVGDVERDHRDGADRRHPRRSALASSGACAWA